MQQYICYVNISGSKEYSRYVTVFSGIGFWAISNTEVFVAKIC